MSLVEQQSKTSEGTIRTRSAYQCGGGEPEREERERGHCARKVGHGVRSPSDSCQVANSTLRASPLVVVLIGETLSSLVGEADRGCVGEIPPTGQPRLSFVGLSSLAQA